MKWLSAHLYCSPPWEDLLSRAVAPFVESQLRAQHVARFFFIRYWQQGPHIRLRLYGEEETLRHTVQPALESVMTARFALHSSPSYGEPVQAASSVLDYPLDSIQFIAYEPEYSRYGGSRGIAIAERQFFLSSQTVFDLLREEPGWSIDRALSAGLHLDLGLLHRMNFELREASALLYQAHFAKQTGLTAQDEELLAVFDRSFARQEASVVARVEEIWEALARGEDFPPGPFHSWCRGMGEIYSELHRAAAVGDLEFTAASHHENEEPGKDGVPFHLVLSYLHMTHNRLGIHFRHETYLAYLLMRSLERLGGGPGLKSAAA